MGIYLDSADTDLVHQANALGFIEGVTINPTLIAQTGRAPLDVLTDLVEQVEGNVFYPLTGQTVEAREDEAWQAYSIRPDRVVLKLPATIENLALVAELSKEIECAMTALYSPAQAYLAVQAGAHFVIPYINHANRLLGDGPALVRAIREVIDSTGVELLAAGIESPDMAVETLRAGADHLTMPLDVIHAMGEHPYSQETISTFAAALQHPAE